MTAAGASAEQLSVKQSQIQWPSFAAASAAAMDFGMQMDQLATGAVNGLANALSSIADLARHTEATVAMLEAIDAEFKRRNAIKAGKPDTGQKLIGRA